MKCCLLFTAFIFILPLSAAAQHIYQWTDENGKVHFSNSPKHSDFAPSALPEVKRENIDERIKSIKEQTPENCINHGGIDCSAGADADGSVVCLDGFRKAVMPFQFECLEARLHGNFFVDVEGEAGYVSHSRNLAKPLKEKKATGFHLSLRNLSGVEAFGVSVDIRLAPPGSMLSNRRVTYHAHGPDRIPAYGSADYVFSFRDGGVAPNLAQIEQSEYKVACTNCGAVMKAQSSQ